MGPRPRQVRFGGARSASDRIASALRQLANAASEVAVREARAAESPAACGWQARHTSQLPHGQHDCLGPSLLSRSPGGRRRLGPGTRKIRHGEQRAVGPVFLCSIVILDCDTSPLDGFVTLLPFSPTSLSHFCLPPLLCPLPLSPRCISSCFVEFLHRANYIVVVNVLSESGRLGTPYVQLQTAPELSSSFSPATTTSPTYHAPATPPSS